MNYYELVKRIREEAGLALEYGFHNDANQLCEYADAIESLQQDAARYRWLRDNQVYRREHDAAHYKALEIAVDMGGLEWDKAIDEAMQHESI